MTRKLFPFGTTLVVISISLADYLGKKTKESELKLNFPQPSTAKIRQEVICCFPMQSPKSRILLVDDKPSVLLTYRIILQQQGHAVTGAATYAEAMSHLDASDFDLLLCDFGLDGDFNGLDVIDYARLKFPALRSVLLTGFSTSELATSAAERGIEVLFKPIDVRDLLATVAGQEVVRAIA